MKITDKMRYLVYRGLMIFAHRFDWHHAPEHGPLEDGSKQRWCQWCGFRGITQQPYANRPFGVVDAMRTYEAIDAAIKSDRARLKGKA